MDYLDSLFSLDGKTALVTGGATGIGRMIAGALVHAGAHVMIVSRKGEDCARAAQELTNEAGENHCTGRAEGFAANIADEAGIEQLVGSVGERADRLDILVNNAGATWGAPIDSFPYAAWGQVLDLNVTGLFNLTRELLPLLERSASDGDPSRVINLGSVMGSVPLGDGAYSYAASKAAVHHLTKILAKELAGRNITFNAFAPGPFPSKMTAFATGTREKADIVKKSVPMRRLGNAEDIAGATLYLCGRGGSYVTGCVLPIDGGVHVATGPNLFEEASQI